MGIDWPVIKKAPLGYTFSRAKMCVVGAFLGARQEMLCRRFCTQWVRAYPLGTLSLNMVGLLNRYYTLMCNFHKVRALELNTYIG